MANGEDNPLQWDMDGNCIQLGRCVFTGTVVFEGNNEIVATTDLESGDYHFRPGWDIIITDSNNNGTYEIYSVDANVIVVTTTAGVAVDWTLDQSDSVTLTGIGYPSDLLSSRTETVNTTEGVVRYFNNITYDGIVYDIISISGYNGWYDRGFRVGMTLTVNGTVATYDGTFTILGFRYTSTRLSLTLIDPNSYSASGHDSDVEFTGELSIDTSNSFNPAALAGHKGRLFAGGVKEYSTRLYYSQ